MTDLTAVRPALRRTYPTQQPVSRRALLGGFGAVVVSAACGDGSAQAASGQGLLARLQAAKRVKVGIANQPPYSALNPDGSLTGVAPDVTKVIMQRLGVPEIEGFIGTYGQLIPGMLADRWDFVSACLTITPARCGQVLFCDPLVYDGDIIVTLKETNSSPPKRLAVLAKLDVTIGVQSGGADLRAVLAAGVSPSNIRQFTTDPAIMDGLLAKRPAYVLMSNAPARTLIAQRSLDVATAFPVEDAPSNGSGCAFRKEDIDFYGAYQKELRAMKVSGEFRAILRRYGFDTSPENESITAEQACSP